MNKYKVGDRVRIRRWEDMEREFGLSGLGSIAVPYAFTSYMRHLCGRTATIQRIGTYWVLLKDWNDTGGKTNWNFSPQMLEPVAQEKIVITHDGKTTTARLYDGKKFLKEAEAVCSPDDEFSFDVGAKLAFSRLLKRSSEIPDTESKWLYCVREYKPDEWLTKGDVYRRGHNGLITLDDGYKSALEGYFEGVKVIPNYLVPLVDRPAKVGEWVYIRQAHPLKGQKYRAGEIFKITHLTDPFFDAACAEYPYWFEREEYLVLDGYQPQ